MGNCEQLQIWNSNMPALMPTKFVCEIVYLGFVKNRKVSLSSVPLMKAFASFSGFDGEDHAGLTRASCIRVMDQHPPGTEIRNVRQFSIISFEEMTDVAAEIGIDELKPEWMGASIMVKGIHDFTHVPPSSRLQAQSGATLVIDMENRPCMYPGKEEIEQHYPGKGKLLKSVLKDRRGVTAWVEREGALKVGDSLTLHMPDQRRWMPNDS
jgi:MOSC domain-containing protein YiiM